MYKLISCVATGVQKGYERFPDHNAPIVKHWRCDLTALSHVYNLYFVAYNTKIYIYEPSFPAQTLGEPIKILKLPRTGAPVPRGIDNEDPHSITRVLVDFFGNDEVLLCTCDDGDVVGFWVRDLYEARLTKRDIFCAKEEIDEEECIRIFTKLNVGQSAWGLAVHRNARLIAISANTHEVRVLAYALAQPDDSLEDDTSGFPVPRHKDWLITLQAKANIPAVSFDNSGADPTGRWLSSSSIDGLTHLWDLSRPDQPAQIIAIGHCASATILPNIIPKPCTCLNTHSYPHATWSAMFIDPRSCHCVGSLAEACGSSVGSKGEPAFRPPCFWDITPMKDETFSKDQTLAVALAGESEAESEESGEMSIDSSNPSVELLSNLAAAPEDEESLFVYDAPPDIPSELEGQTEIPLPLSANADIADADDDDVSLEDEDGDVLWYKESKKPYCSYKTAKFVSEKDIPELHPLIIVTKDEIYLLQRALHRSLATVLTMRSPLYSVQRPDSVLYNAYHRQLFTAQIPDLGVFIVASPAGAAGIFRLTRTIHEGREMIGFRLDHVLPGALGVDGEEHLVGVAVGPVQGMLDGEGWEAGKRRWRLLMYWHDHTVSAYELGKFEEGEGELEGLVV
ncbi:hypothetical protein BU23DRAFT_291850 [Bimuria novae-zelandiae CBS 107.79]|uniref:WD40 repeat-like protein n=1 Tax=Bimuria novae-zelandiae CBS 107.79 TaxID=1447943 RepID=A0A6A5UTR9_9PLEO|nr:hypothetical protein BU23DRAFT_291850 [Bimuria novae-zelandiae CBS 107.79]